MRTMVKISTLCIVCIAGFSSVASAQVEGDECGWPFNAVLGSNDFDTTTATPSTSLPDDTMCEGSFLDWGSKNPDVWFKFTPTTGGDFSFTTCDASGFTTFDTSIVLYEGSCDNQVACNGDDPTADNSCQQYYSTIEYPLTLGYSYYVRVGGWNGDSGIGSLTITEAGIGEVTGACCLDFGNGEYSCFLSTRDNCIAEGGVFTKGATCSEISCGVVIPTFWYVNLNNTNPGSGTSWGSAFLDLQDALDVAASGDQIWVAQGTYHPSDTSGSNDPRESAYRLIAGVEIYGGFIGNETDVHERNPYVNKVHFSGDLNGDDGDSGDNSENAYHVFLADNLVGEPPVLDGVFIRQGNADGSAPHHGGGGLKVMNYQAGTTAIPLIFQTAFLQNNGRQAGAIAVTGGNEGISLVRCVIANNTSVNQGGGLRNGGTTRIDNCLIVANSTSQDGGAIYSNQGLCTIVNSTIAQNKAGFIGGIYAASGSITGTNNVLWGNIDDFGADWQMYFANGAVWSGDYNCIQGMGGSIGGVGNIEANPRFVDEFGLDEQPATGDENFRLFQLSPCIDAGDNTAVTQEVDLVGMTRILDDPFVVNTGNNPLELPGVVDMGAYEHDQANDAVWIWSGANSSVFNDPENWYQNGAPDSDSNVMFNGNQGNLGYVLFNQTHYLNTLHVTGGEFTFDLDSNDLTLRGQSRSIRVDPFSNNASANFKGPGTMYSLNPIDFESGKISFSSGISFYIDSLNLGEGSSLAFDGSIIGDVTNDGATILPAGHGLGSFMIDGNLYNQNNDNSPSELIGSLAFDIAGYTPGETHDYLNISAAADLSTAIELRWNFVPNANDAFDVLNVGTATGTPPLIYNTGLPANLACRWNYSASGVRGSGDAAVETTGPILFEESDTYALTASPTEIVVADLDSDGDPDIAMSISTGEFTTGNVVILINEGMSGGAWQVTELAPIDVGWHPVDIAVMDIDGDGISNDLVVANYWSSTVSVLTNDGTATFTKTDVSTDWGPEYIAIADFYTLDGLTREDIGVACGSFDISILQNTTSLIGTSFNHVSSIGTAQPGDILPGDVNTDKDIDYVILNIANEKINIFDGDGTGTYPPYTAVGTNNLVTGSDPAEMAFADLDGDSLDDLITVNEGNGTISVLLGNGTGLQVFGSGLGNASSVAVGTSPQEISVYDFDNDSDDDFVLSVVGTISTEREIAVVRNDTPALGSVTLSQSTSTVGSGSEPILLRHGDINQDGLEDIVSLIDLAIGVRGQNSPAIAVYFNTTEVVVDCPADIDGDGSVAVNDLLAIIAAWGSADASLDLDGSGIVDVGDLLVIIAAWGAC